MNVRTLAAACGVTVLAGCGSESPGMGSGPTEPVDAIQRRELRVEAASRSPVRTRDLPEGFTTAGVTAAGELLVARRSDLFSAGSQGLERLELFASDGADVPVADVVAIAPRPAGGAWVVGTNGLYRTEGRFHVVVDPSLTGVRRAFTTAVSPLDGLWLTTAGGLVRLAAESFSSYDVPSPLDIVDLDVSADGTSVMVAWSDTVRLLVVTPNGIELQDTAGSIAGSLSVARNGGRWWVGSDAIYETSAPRDGWTAYELSSAPTDLGTGSDGKLWWRSGDGVFVYGDPAQRIMDEEVSSLVFAPTGDVWALTSSTAHGWLADASRVGFSQDVLPWLRSEGCVDCHADRGEDFTDYDYARRVGSDSLRRVQSGDMPRCGAGLCPPNDRLTPEDYSVLERWLEAGAPE